MCVPPRRLVGWVERSETHHVCCDDMMGFASAQPILLHAGDAEARGSQRTDFRLAADREAEGENFSRIPRIDEAVVPQPRRGVERGRLAGELVDDLLLHRLERAVVDRL